MERKPVEDPEFWRGRIQNVLDEGKLLHQAIWDDSYEIWNLFQYQTTQLLIRKIKSGLKVLDAGCGLGSLVQCVQDAKLLNHHYRLDYTGVDVSPDLVRVAGERHPGYRFEVQNLRSLPYGDKTFHWAVCRYVESMIIPNAGVGVWLEMQSELCRVAKSVLIMDCPKDLNSEAPWRIINEQGEADRGGDWHAG